MKLYTMYLKAFLGILLTMQNICMSGTESPVQRISQELIYAAQTGNCTRAKELLSTFGIYININMRNKEGNRALMSAYQKGHTAIVEAMIEANAALEMINTRAGYRLYNMHYCNTALIEAVYYGHAHIVAMLLNTGTAINTPIAAGAHVNVCDRQISQEHNHMRIIELFDEYERAHKVMIRPAFKRARIEESDIEESDDE